MNRFGAFAVHLGISLLIFILIGYVILFHWYPEFFFVADGGWQGVRIIALVDLVLGPVLTLVVYKKDKPSLKFDLTAIGVFQAVCLAAGIWVVYSERPIAMVFSDGSFQSMTADDYTQLGEPVPRFAGGSPYWVTVKLPEDFEAQSAIRRDAIAARRPLKTMVELYVTFEVSHINQDSDGITPAEIASRPDVFEKFLSEHGGSLADYLFLPFGTRYVPALLALRMSTEELIYLPVPVMTRAEPGPVTSED